MKSGLNRNARTGTAGGAEETLRVVANLPAPDGLVDRVQTRLRTAPGSARVLSWPSIFAPGGWGYAPALRGAAAAAIVCVVAGGGWRIYSHVQPAASARVITVPTPANTGGGFSTAGTVHRPDPGPVVVHRPEALTNEPRTPEKHLDEGLVQGKRPYSAHGNKHGNIPGRVDSTAGSAK